MFTLKKSYNQVDQNDIWCFTWINQVNATQLHINSLVLQFLLSPHKSWYGLFVNYLFCLTRSLNVFLFVIKEMTSQKVIWIRHLSVLVNSLKGFLYNLSLLKLSTASLGEWSVIIASFSNSSLSEPSFLFDAISAGQTAALRLHCGFGCVQSIFVKCWIMIFKLIIYW